MRPILAHPAARGNAAASAMRTNVATEPPPTHPAKPGHPIIPRSRRTLAEIQADSGLSNGARRLAAYLDGRCLATGKWAAWPKVSTIAGELGWDGDPRAFRKRVERYFRELVGSGDVARPRAGELVAWYDAEGADRGLAWPAGLRRNLCRSSAVTVLGWKLAEAESKPPILTACDISVASSGPVGGDPTPRNVACDPPKMSHGDPPKMSHPQNVRTLNVESEPNTLDAVALAAGEGEPPTMPTAAPDLSRTIAADRLCRELLMTRDLRPTVTDAATAGAIEWKVPPGRGPLPDAGELSEIVRLWPEFLEALRSRNVKFSRSSPTTPLTGERSVRHSAAKVTTLAQASVRAAIGRLTCEGATSGDVLAASKALVAALGPHRDYDLTVATFHRLCGQVRKGSVAEAFVQEAFEAACGRKVEGRGALFVHLVKQAIRPEARGRMVE